MSDIFLGTPYILVSVSKYLDNGTATVPILAEIGIPV